MKKLLFAAALCASFFAIKHLPASATACTIPNTFTAGTPAVAAQVNANFVALQTCGNSIDHTNIGSSGIYASQIIPDTTGHATFGGSIAYTFQNGLTVTGGFIADTATVNGPETLQGTTAGPNSSVGIWNDGASPGGLIVNVPTGSNGVRFSTNGSANGAKVDANGRVQDQCNGCTVATYVMPVYTAAGAAIGSTLHGVVFTLSPVANGNCAANTSCTLTSNSASLSASALFSSATSWSCSASVNAAPFNEVSVTVQINFTNATTMNVSVLLYNIIGSTISSGTTFTLAGNCIGT